MKREYFYDPTKGVAHCFLKYKGMEFSGTAICHPEDGDFMSERTGLYIAETRANIRYLKSKKPELRAAITALQHAVNCMRDSKDFNPKAKEFQIVYRLLYDKKSELDSLNSRIKMEKEYLEDYMKNKDIVHNKMRKGKLNQVNE